MSDYRQCEMRKGSRFQVAWIPKKLARLHGYLRIGDDDGWLITAVGTVSPPAYVLERKSHRRGDFGSLVNV